MLQERPEGCKYGKTAERTRRLTIGVASNQLFLLTITYNTHYQQIKTRSSRDLRDRIRWVKKLPT